MCSSTFFFSIYIFIMTHTAAAVRIESMGNSRYAFSIIHTAPALGRRKFVPNSRKMSLSKKTHSAGCPLVARTSKSYTHTNTHLLPPPPPVHSHLVPTGGYRKIIKLLSYTLIYISRGRRPPAKKYLTTSPLLYLATAVWKTIYKNAQQQTQANFNHTHTLIRSVGVYKYSRHYIMYYNSLGILVWLLFFWNTMQVCYYIRYSEHCFVGTRKRVVSTLLLFVHAKY